MSAIVALTAQNTVGVTAVQEVAPEFVHAQLDAVFSDIGVDAAKTGMLYSREIVETVAAFLAEHPVPLVVDPVMISPPARSSSRTTPSRPSSRCSSAGDRDHAEPPRGPGARRRRQRGSRRARRAAPRARRAAVLVTGGHGERAVDHLFTSGSHVEILVERHDVAATHGAGCTHSATLAALLAQGQSLEDAARGAAEAAADAVAHGLVGLGEGEGPVDVLHVADAR